MGEVLLSEVVSHAVQKFAAAEIETPQVDAELIAAHILNFSRGEVQAALLTGFILTEEQTKLFAEYSARRFTREPLQHITGFAYFRQLQLSVGRGVFVPRPETEVVVQIAIDELRASELEAPIAVDLGTGSGAIAIAVNHERPDVTVTAVDRSTAALSLARENADRIGVAIELLESDLAAAVTGRTFDVVAANLPYIPDGDPRTEAGVVRHEPHLALYAGPDGLDLIRRLVADAPALLNPGGMIVLENSDEQAAAVRGLLEAAGFVDVACHRDLAGVDRVVAGRLG